MFLARISRSSTLLGSCHDRSLSGSHARTRSIDILRVRAEKKLRNGDTHDAHRTYTSPSKDWRLTNLTFRGAPLRGHRRCSRCPLHALELRGPLLAVGRRRGPRALSLSLRLVVPALWGSPLPLALALAPLAIPLFPLVVIRSWYPDRDERCYRLSPLGDTTVYTRERVRTPLSFLSLFYVSLLVRSINHAGSNLRSTERDRLSSFLPKRGLRCAFPSASGCPTKSRGALRTRIHRAIKAVMPEQIRLNRCLRSCLRSFRLHGANVNR